MVVIFKIENIMGKEENAGYQHLPNEHIVFERLHSLGFKNPYCLVRGEGENACYQDILLFL